MKTYVLYHASCADGFCAAWVARGVLGAAAEYIPVQHGTPPPEMEAGARVYVLDFSYKRPVMLDIIARAGSVIVLDHHRTAAVELAGLNDEMNADITFDLNKSGGRLAWEHFHGLAPSPWLVDYTEDRDLWRWALPCSREVSACIRSHPFDFALWDYWGEMGEHKARAMFFAEGSAILRDQRQTVETHVRNAREVEMSGHKILAVNATTLTSEIAGALAEGRPFGACYFDRADGKRVWSLRSRDGGVDVSEIARANGGGGHRQAAGYEQSL